MKVRADEHVSQEIVQAVQGIALSPGWELSHVITTSGAGTDDVPWITSFANDGGNVILTGDNDFLKRHHQVMAVHAAGLKVIHLPHKWCNARCDLQAAFILTWWKRIENKLAGCAARECWKPPWNLVETGDLMKITIDYEKARRKVRKSSTGNPAA